MKKSLWTRWLLLRRLHQNLTLTADSCLCSSYNFVSPSEQTPVPPRFFSNPLFFHFMATLSFTFDLCMNCSFLHPSYLPPLSPKPTPILAYWGLCFFTYNFFFQNDCTNLYWQTMIWNSIFLLFLFSSCADLSQTCLEIKNNFLCLVPLNSLNKKKTNLSSIMNARPALTLQCFWIQFDIASSSVRYLLHGSARHKWSSSSAHTTCNYI